MDVVELWSLIRMLRHPNHSAPVLWRGSRPRFTAGALDEALRLNWLSTADIAASRRAASGEATQVMGRRLMRNMFVASALDESVDGVQLTTRCPHCGGVDHGPPVLSKPHNRHLQVGAASCLDYFAVVTAPCSIGVDVESRERFSPSLDRRPDEDVHDDDDVDRDPHEDPHQEFDVPDEVLRALAGSGHTVATRIEMWTAWEALSKATGLGLLAEPKDIERAVATHKLRWFGGGAEPLACVAVDARHNADVVDVVLHTASLITASTRPQP